MNFLKPGRWLSLALLMVLSGCAKQTTSPPPSPDQLKKAMDDGISYMVRSTKPSGEFVYLDDLLPNRRHKPIYNVLRHAGAMYALADSYSYKPDPEVKAALVRAAKWLQKKYIKPIKAEKGVLAVWSLPSDLHGDGPMEVKLGGIGLGLVGLLQTEKVAPGTTSLEMLRQLGNGILWLQNPDGSFYSKYDPAQGGKMDNWTSLYYPGEAALGLAMLAEHDPDPKLKTRWINAAFRAVGNLARLRAGARDVPADHWVLIATARLWPLYAYSDQTISRAALLNHALQICTVIVNDPALRDVRTTPIATRVEGMNAALTFLPPEQQQLREKIHEEVERGVAFLMKTQAKDGPHRGAVPRAFTPAGGNPVDDRATELRIDYIQHALSAWLECSRQKKMISSP